MKDSTNEKTELFRLQAGWILRKPPNYVSREEREWLPWGERRVAALMRGAAPCPADAADAAGGCGCGRPGAANGVCDLNS